MSGLISSFSSSRNGMTRNGQAVPLEKRDLELSQHCFGQALLGSGETTVSIKDRVRRNSGQFNLHHTTLQPVLRRAFSFPGTHDRLNNVPWRDLKARPDISPEELYRLLCIHGKEIRSLGLNRVMLNWNSDEKKQLVELIPLYCPKLKAFSRCPIEAFSIERVEPSSSSFRKRRKSTLSFSV